MSRRRRPKPDLTGLAAELGPEDGGDPKEFHGKPWERERPAGRKALQLCGQVQDPLHAALAACGDGVLQSLRVARVEPAPHTGRLRVTVVPDEGTGVAAATDRLAGAAGRLRAVVAAAVHRRRAPELVFEVIG
jgi:ribosome-binding factor A